MPSSIKPGIYPDMSSEQYHGDHLSYSKTNLSNLSTSPLAMDFARKNPESKPAWDRGTATHTLVLQPEVWERDIAVMPPDIKVRRGKAWDEFAAAHRGMTIITQDDHDAVVAMRDSLWANPLTRKLFTASGAAEASVFWNLSFSYDEDLGWNRQGLGEKEHIITLKCRPDFLPGNFTVIDLKTTSKITADAFSRDAYNYHYHWSAYLTLTGLEAATGDVYDQYVFACVENKPPYDVATFYLPQAEMDLAREQVEEVLPKLVQCDYTGMWPGQPVEIQPLRFPAYAFKSHTRQLFDGIPTFV